METINGLLTPILRRSLGVISPGMVRGATKMIISGSQAALMMCLMCRGTAWERLRLNLHL